MKKDIERTYTEFASNQPVKLEIVKRLCSVLNIPHSAAPAQIPKQRFNMMMEQIEGQLPIIKSVFNVSSTSKDYHINGKNIVSKVFESWNGSKIKNGKRAQITLNGVRRENTSYVKESAAMLWDSLLRLKPPAQEPSNGIVIDLMNIIEQQEAEKQRLLVA